MCIIRISKYFSNIIIICNEKHYKNSDENLFAENHI